MTEQTKVSDPPSIDDVETPTPDIKALRERVPAHCFQPSLAISFQYVIRDFVLAAILFKLALYIPLIDHYALRILSWTVYGFVQGLVFTGVWILAHECGHNAFSIYPKVNSVVGFFLHSVILVPFFSWKYSHARHHRYTNHMDKDTVFSPSRKEEYRTTFWNGDFLKNAEDSPLLNIALFLGHQILGWPAYILMNAGAGSESLVTGNKSTSTRQSHLDPTANLFYSDEHPFVMLSNIGLAAVFFALWQVSNVIGVYNTCLIYGLPYLWMNHWLVAITFMHHTHPETPHYEASSWTFSRGALATIDRDFGFIGRHLFHGIIEYHVVHHFFPRIPFYYAEEATEAIAPLLGKSYKRQQTSFLQDLWSTFTTCDYVEESKRQEGCMYWAKANKL